MTGAELAGTVHVAPFGLLPSTTLYALLRLRVDIFVVEQNCPYPELDGKDDHALHMMLKRGDEIIAHGHTNAVRQSSYGEDDERVLLTGCRERIAKHSGKAPSGWLSPWIAESLLTPEENAELLRLLNKLRKGLQ